MNMMMLEPKFVVVYKYIVAPMWMKEHRSWVCFINFQLRFTYEGQKLLAEAEETKLEKFRQIFYGVYGLHGVTF